MFDALSRFSALWPIQTVALAFTGVFVLYVVFVDVLPLHGSSIGPLARTFEVSSRNVWKPVESPNLTPYVATAVDFAGEYAQEARAFLAEKVSQLAKGSDLVLPEQDFTSFIATFRTFQLKNGNMIYLNNSHSWVIWAKWTVARVYDLISAADRTDLIVVTLGWVGMYVLFVQLFLRMRKLGSRTYLFAAALLSSTFAFLGAYGITVFAGIYVPKRALAQGLPFLVLINGFEPKSSLARESLRLLGDNLAHHGSKSSADIIVEALGLVSMRDVNVSMIFLGIVSLCGRGRIRGGLWEFCVLSTLTLALDIILYRTFFVANMSLKLTVARMERNDAIRRALAEDGVSNAAAHRYADAATSTDPNSSQSNSGSSGSVRLLLAIAFLGLNWLTIRDVPVTLSFRPEDLTFNAGPPIPDIASRMSLPAVLKIVPPIRFESAPGRLSINELLANRSIQRALVCALMASLMLNGYFVSMARKQTLSVYKPIVLSPQPESQSVHQSTRDGDEEEEGSSSDDGLVLPAKKVRSLEDCMEVMKEGLTANLNDEEVVQLAVKGKLPLYALEKQLKNSTRAVCVRRAAISRLSRTHTLEHSALPWKNYDYDRVLGACCENVVGYLPLPLGLAGPLCIDGVENFLPMATTEGVLVASTMRGCKALNGGGGVTTEILGDGMTRGPCVSFDTSKRSATAKRWLDSVEGTQVIKDAFNATSRFARLESIKSAVAGNFLYIRFRAQTGDAMGMNMISKGVESALRVMAEDYGFDDMSIVSLSGNYCTDKKSAAINWIEGRGKSVVAESRVPAALVTKLLKTTVDDLVDLNMAKNLIGSNMAGAMGGFNAHAANLVAAVYLATGQDPAQVVEGSSCMTLMSNVEGDLQISVSMPCLEVGTIGGGTILEPQAAMLEMLGIRGPHSTEPGANARALARIVASAVLAGELSLCSALAAGHLVKSHMAHNRSKAPSDSSAQKQPNKK